MDGQRLNTNRQPRLAPGQLRALVAAHLRAHPDLELTIPDLARALGRSRGAITKAIAALVAAGAVRQVAANPDRFTAADDDVRA